MWRFYATREKPTRSVQTTEPKSAPSTQRAAGLITATSEAVGTDGAGGAAVSDRAGGVAHTHGAGGVATTDGAGIALGKIGEAER